MKNTDISCGGIWYTNYNFRRMDKLSFAYLPLICKAGRMTYLIRLTLKIVQAAVILFLQGRSKKIQDRMVHGPYGLDVNFSNNVTRFFDVTKFLCVIKIHSRMFSIENGICHCYTFLTGTNKRDPTHYDRWTIFMRSEFEES
jgi:hypothetical protein